MQHPLPVWGFPNGYDPNLMGDRCDRCGASSWLPRPIPGQDFTAWTCARCTLQPNAPAKIPD